MKLLNYDQQYEASKHLIILITISLLVVWSGLDAVDYFAWVMLTLPSLGLILGLSLTYKKFQFSTLTYVMVFFHIIVLLFGAKYRYAGVPLGIKITEMFDLNRNYFDRVGHFFQGFAPMFMFKELMLRKGYMKRSKFFYFVLMMSILGISASWELSEFFATLITQKPASYILSSQGVLWDTQWDMVLAVIGGATTLTIFGKYHDHRISELKEVDQKAIPKAKHS